MDIYFRNRIYQRLKRVCGEEGPMIHQITIATSLAPGKSIDTQRSAVNSWKRIGFHVVSINAAEEIALLQPKFPDIEFIQVARDAKKKFGKPYVYFDDALAYFQGCGPGICGIVNSDIYLLHEDLYPFISREAINSLVYGSRVDVDTLENLQGQMLYDGFDYFFFDKQMVSLYPQSELFIGLPCWDYWAALIPLFSGIPLKKIITPHAYHIKHRVNWDNRASQVLYKGAILKHFKLLTAAPVSPYYIVEFIYKYSAELTLNDNKSCGDCLSNQCPSIRQVINNGVNAKIIDDLMFVTKGH